VVVIPAATRTGGARFGQLTHAVLALAPLDADLSVVTALADVQGRILSATAEEVTACAATVAGVLEHPLLARARTAAARGQCRRETPITRTLADGTLLEGVVDLAFEDNGRWMVLDYKTDRELASAGEEQYRRQVGLYAAAIAEATGQPSSGVLVRI
jgi:ATP-dependent exoDNAse (exonuclease V) beta subunit